MIRHRFSGWALNLARRLVEQREVFVNCVSNSYVNVRV